jgi:hypothetical protein
MAMAKEFIPGGMKRWHVQCRVTVEVTAPTTEVAQAAAYDVLTHKFPANATWHIGNAWEKYSPETIYTSEGFTPLGELPLK